MRQILRKLKKSLKSLLSRYVEKYNALKLVCNTIFYSKLKSLNANTLTGRPSMFGIFSGTINTRYIPCAIDVKLRFSTINTLLLSNIL